MDEPDTNQLIQQLIDKVDALSIQVGVNAKKCDENYKSTDFDQDQLNDKSKTLVEGMDKMKLEIRDLKVENANLKTTVESLIVKKELHEDKFEISDRENKRSNLCIDGVVEREGLSLLKVVNDLFRDLEIPLKAEVCQSIYQKGTNNDQDDTNQDQLLSAFEM